MTHERKHERREIVKQWKAEQLSELHTQMPLSLDLLHELLNYLDDTHHLGCDRTTKRTELFLDKEGLDKSKVLAWLAEYGGYCDCEVLFNLDDVDRGLRTPSTRPEILPTKKQNAPRDLGNAPGWDLTKLPGPWRIGNLYASDEPIHLQVGKKGGCTLTIIEVSMPPGDQASDTYWSALWYARTNLPERGPLRINHAILSVPSSLRATLVQAPQWLPVYGWIFPIEGAWHIELKTDSNRVHGDLVQIAALIANFTGSSTSS